MYNDEALLASRPKGELIWASGGGTYLLNNRYLPVVQRSRDVRVNPGKFSLFTGRADNTEELLHPVSLVRELFEELILFTGHRLYRPVCKGTGPIIDVIYNRLKTYLGLEVAAAKPLRLEQLFCAPKMTTVINHGVQWEGLLDCHVGSYGEVNVLFVLAGEIDIDNLRAMDGEYHLRDGKAILQNRSIYLYDLQTAIGKNITVNCGGCEQVLISDCLMSEHLRHLVRSIKRNQTLDRIKHSLIQKTTN